MSTETGTDEKTTEIIDMTALAEQNMQNRTFFSAFMFNLFDDDQESLFMKVYEASADKRHFEVDLKINGIPIKIRPFIELIEKQLDLMIAEEAADLLKEKLSGISEGGSRALHHVFRSQGATMISHTCNETHFYVYSFKRGRYVYERTCGTEAAAKEWVLKYGPRALYTINATINGAFY